MSQPQQIEYFHASHRLHFGANVSSLGPSKQMAFYFIDFYNYTLMFFTDSDPKPHIRRQKYNKKQTKQQPISEFWIYGVSHLRLGAANYNLSAKNHFVFPFQLTPLATLRLFALNKKGKQKFSQDDMQREEKFFLFSLPFYQHCVTGPRQHMGWGGGNLACRNQICEGWSKNHSP